MEEKNGTQSAPGQAAEPNSVEASVRAAALARIDGAKTNAEHTQRAVEEALAAERMRVADIRGIVRNANLPDGVGEALADDLIKQNASVDQVRKVVLDHLVRGSDAFATDGHVRIGAGEDRRDKFIRGATASIIERAGHTETILAAKTVKRIAPYLKDAETDAGEFRGMRLVDLARSALEMRGVSTKGLHGEALVKRALQYRDAGMNTTSDFTVLLESAVNRVFLGRYATIPVSWPLWCARKSVQDFRTTTFYRPGSFGKLDSVGEAGEIKHKNIPDGGKATLTPATKGNIIGITRRAIVNDDLGVFRDLGAGLGEAAALTVESDAWGLFSSGLGVNAPDGTALFDAAHGNIGTTGAMSVATLDSIRSKMALQKDTSSNAFLAARPSILLVPVELGGTAKVFNSSSADPTDNKSSGVANKVQGLFPGGIIDSPYLSALSAVRHYGLADPSILPVFAVGFLDGQEAPRIESRESFEVDGLQMRVVLDYGVAVLGYRGAVTCAGQ
jgi:hypothetical protein